MEAIRGIGHSFIYNLPSRIIDVRVHDGKIIPVIDEIRLPEDERDFVLIDEIQYTACEGVDYKGLGFCKLGDTWVYPEEEPVRWNRESISLDG